MFVDFSAQPRRIKKILKITYILNPITTTICNLIYLEEGFSNFLYY